MDMMDARAADLDERAGRRIAAPDPPVAEARRTSQKQGDGEQKTGCG
jgi:hypothetical protein